MTTKAKKRAPASNGQGIMRISIHVKDHSNDPYVLQKAKEAEEVLNRVGLPKEVKGELSSKD